MNLEKQVSALQASLTELRQALVIITDEKQAWQDEAIELRIKLEQLSRNLLESVK